MALDTQGSFKSKTLTDVSSYIDVGAVQFLETQTRDQAIQTLVGALSKLYDLGDPQQFYQAVLEREKVASTGIGMGVAIPHAKLSIYNDFFIAVGVLKKGIDWNSMDNQDVRLIFLIGGPDDKQSHYLNLLSQLTLYLRDEEVRKKLLSLSNPEQIVEVFHTIKGTA